MNRQWRLATHYACAHDRLTRPIQVEVTLYLCQNRYRKPRCRIGLLYAHIFSGGATPDRACQSKCPGRNTSALAAALAAKGGNNKIKYQDILTAAADAINGLSMPCQKQRTDAATPHLAALACTCRQNDKPSQVWVPSEKAE